MLFQMLRGPVIEKLLIFSSTQFEQVKIKMKIHSVDEKYILTDYQFKNISKISQEEYCLCSS